MPRVTKISKIGNIYLHGVGARLVSIQYMSSAVAFVYTVFKLHSTMLATLTICLHRPLALLIKSPYSHLRYSLKCMRNGIP